jgi:hypothetical protein
VRACDALALQSLQRIQPDRAKGWVGGAEHSQRGDAEYEAWKGGDVEDDQLRTQRLGRPLFDRWSKSDCWLR